MFFSAFSRLTPEGRKQARGTAAVQQQGADASEWAVGSCRRPKCSTLVRVMQVHAHAARSHTHATAPPPHTHHPSLHAPWRRIRFVTRSTSLSRRAWCSLSSRACSSVTLMAVRSLADLHAVMRAPCRQRTSWALRRSNVVFLVRPDPVVTVNCCGGACEGGVGVGGRRETPVRQPCPARKRCSAPPPPCARRTAISSRSHSTRWMEAQVTTPRPRRGGTWDINAADLCSSLPADGRGGSRAWPTPPRDSLLPPERGVANGGRAGDPVTPGLAPALAPTAALVADAAPCVFTPPRLPPPSPCAAACESLAATDADRPSSRMTESGRAPRGPRGGGGVGGAPPLPPFTRPSASSNSRYRVTYSRRMQYVSLLISD